MTPQERELLTQLTQRINQTQLQEKDPDAQNLLGRELGANPDALYILAQTVLVQDMALQQARREVSQLQQQLEEARRQAQQQPAAQHSTSFLGRLLGERDEPQAPPPPPAQQQWRQPSQPPFQPVQYAPQTPPPYGAPQYFQPGNAPGYAPGFAPGYAVPAGQPSFLRGAMQTAAGVAAGALAFEGIESLLHGFGHGGGMGMGGFGMGSGMGMGGGFGRPIEETVVNNYYDQPVAHSSGENNFDQGDNLRGFDNSGDTATQNFAGAAAFDNPADRDSVQTSDPGQGSDYAQLSGDSLDDSGGLDDSSLADGSLDDGSSDLSDSGLDDSGGFDSGGFDGGNFDSGTDNGF